MHTFFLIFLGGGLGAAARHGLNWQLGKSFGLHSHWAVLAVNLLGCLTLGLIAEYCLRQPNPAWRLLLITGFLGGFTTYSGFIFDFLTLARSTPHTALLHLGLHLAGGIAACLLGLYAGKGLLT